MYSYTPEKIAYLRSRQVHHIADQLELMHSVRVGAEFLVFLKDKQITC